MNKSLVVIDGKSIFYRGYHAMPYLNSSKGVSLGGVYGFSLLAFNIINKLFPDYVCVAWDKRKTNIRSRQKLYPGYKAKRQPASEEFYEQIPHLFKLLKALNWPLYELDDYEADDIMATFARQAEAKNIQTLLVSSDLDLLQALGPKTKLYALKNGFKNLAEFDESEFQKKYGIEVSQFRDLKALMGDSSDNVPGVSGIGIKTATQLLQDYSSLDGVYKNLGKIKPPVAEKLKTDKKMAYLSQKLVNLCFDVPVKLDLKAMTIDNLDEIALQKALREFEFYSLLGQIPKGMKTNNGEDLVAQTHFLLKKPGIEFHDGFEDLQKLNWQKPIFLHAYCQGRFGRKLLCLLAADNQKILHVYKGSANLPDLKIKTAQIYGYDTKQLVQVLSDFNIIDVKVVHDLKVGAFLINSLLRQQSLSSLAADELGYIGELDELTLEDFSSKVQDIAAICQELKKRQLKMLAKTPKLKQLALEIEWPFIPVLARLERAGMMIDVEILQKLKSEFRLKIETLEESIYDLAGEVFNLASPLQLAQILYHKLKLPTKGISKTKSAYSTNAAALLRFKDKFPIVNLILEWRELSKLQNTYVHGLLSGVEDGRVHSEMRLTAVSTGRLSSANPNLQNIPLRTDLGASVRRAFIAPKNYKLISADYNQFELRLVAALSSDRALIKAFNEGIDIHQLTASLIFEIDIKEVSKLQRSIAKTINFGVLYGQGPRSLSLIAGMSYSDAQSFIEKYFAQRPVLKRYLEKIKQSAEKQGYVETFFGRRRFLPEIKSGHPAIKEAALRQAANMPIQGTEADLMKMAMVQLEDKLDSDCRQIMQVHDSIILECPDDKVDSVSRLVKKVLENVYPDIGINLKVDISIGQSWPI